MTKDPVCGMTVDPATARSHEHQGKAWYFCSEKCRGKFIAAPAQYMEHGAHAFGGAGAG